MIDSTPANQVLSQQTMVNMFKILETACFFSHRVANKLFGESTLLDDLSVLIPQDAKQTQQGPNEEYKLVSEVISLLQSMISEREDQESDQSKIESSTAMKASEKLKRVYQIKQTQ